MTLGNLQERTEQSDAQPSIFGDLGALWVGAGQEAALGTWGDTEEGVIHDWGEIISN